MINVVPGVSASVTSAVACEAALCRRCLSHNPADMMALCVIWLSLWCLLMSAMVRTQSVCSAPSIRFSSRFGLSGGVFAAGSRDGSLDRVDWSMSYVDTRFSCLVVIDLRFPFVHVVEDDCNGSVGSQRACLRHVMHGNAAGHSVVAFAALCHPSEDSHRIRGDGSVEVEVFRGSVAEGSGSKGG